jgi:hypothetical protein
MDSFDRAMADRREVGVWTANLWRPRFERFIAQNFEPQDRQAAFNLFHHILLNGDPFGRPVDEGYLEKILMMGANMVRRDRRPAVGIKHERLIARLFHSQYRDVAKRYLEELFADGDDEMTALMQLIDFAEQVHENHDRDGPHESDIEILRARGQIDDKTRDGLLQERREGGAKSPRLQAFWRRQGHNGTSWNERPYEVRASLLAGRRSPEPHRPYRRHDLPHP